MRDETTTPPPHPMQPVVWVDDVLRFKENAIVRYLLDHGSIDMNHLATIRHFTDEDRMQFAQLIGYSVAGYGDLSYVTDANYAQAAAAAVSLPLPAPAVPRTPHD